MTTTTTIDQKVRANARRASDAEVKAAADRLMGYCEHGHLLTLQFDNNGGMDVKTDDSGKVCAVRIKTWKAIGALLEHAKANYGAKKADEAVREFVHKVEALMGELGVGGEHE